MIDGNAIFDAEGVAYFGKDIYLLRLADGYLLSADDNTNLSQDEVYALGLALARLADVNSTETK